jgi:hypothetical protein
MKTNLDLNLSGEKWQRFKQKLYFIQYIMDFFNKIVNWNYHIQPTY